MTLLWTEARCDERGVDYAKLKSADSRLKSLIEQVLQPAGLRLVCIQGCLYIDHSKYPRTDGKGQVHESHALASLESDCLRGE